MCKHTLGVFLLALFLAACNSDSNRQKASSEPQPTITEPESPPEIDEQEEEEQVVVERLTRFSLANKCIAIRPAGADQWLVRSDSGGYVASAEHSQQAAGFYFKPSKLGEYMLYSDYESLLRVKRNDRLGVPCGMSGFRLGNETTPADHTSWNVTHWE